MEGTHEVMEQIAPDRLGFDAETHEHFAAREKGFESGGGQVGVGVIADQVK